MAVEKKRVFIGGLFHGVTEQQVCDRFNKFGQVDSVSVQVKTDETGQPVKTFAYVDITATEKALRQCMQVYNKSKWKGSELQLQWAKENFLDRFHGLKSCTHLRHYAPKLKKEQAEAKDQINMSVEKSVSETEELPIALKAAPKKATPGTLVGEEKTWVVGKYGRVLPIVNIRRKDKKRVILFDPSKCCHQVKKLDTTTTGCETEKRVDSLTWQLDDDNSLIAKLRTGQVVWEKPVKIKKTPQKVPNAGIETSHSPKGHHDSVDENQFEIVKPRYMRRFHQQDDDEAYSSADTEEMITQMKSSSVKKSGNDTSYSDKVTSDRPRESTSAQTKAGLGVFKRADISAISPIGACVNGSVGKPQGLSVPGQMKVLNPVRQSMLKTSTPKQASAKRVYVSDSESDSSLEQMQPKQTKKKKSKLSKIARHDESDSSQDTDDIISDLRHKVGTPRQAWTTVCSERSLYVTADDDDDQPLPESRTQSSSHSDDNDEDVFDLIESGRIDQLYKTAKGSPNFKDASNTSQEQSTEVDGGNPARQSMLKTSTPKEASAKRVYDSDSESDSSLEQMQPKQTKNKKSKLSKIARHDESDSKPTTAAQNLSVSTDVNNKKDDTSLVSSDKIKPKKKKVKKTSESNAAVSPVVAASVEKSKEKKEKSAFTQKFDKRKLSNAQRVTSVNERLKEARSQKLLIKKALSDVDKTSAKKIIFDSSDEEEVAPQTVSVSKQGQGKGSSDETSSSDDDSDPPSSSRQEDKVKKTKGLLFDSDSGSSESEDEDQQMFQLRPEFEGKAGSKLMKLQSRFRNDQRFKLDKRFLESDSEGDDEDEATVHRDDLEEGSDERARSLAILKSVVGEKAVQHINQRSKKTATFRDVAALHYDPSREDHKHFELDKPVTNDDKDSEEELAEKTSKKKKKKQKGDEPSNEDPPVPEKLPEKFFEVSGALKDLLKPVEKKPFSLLSMFGGTQVEDSDVTKKVNDDAVAETLPVGHMQWQPQFGSDDSDEESDGASLSVSEETKAVEPVKSDSSQEQKTFFFVDNDPRIANGIKCFCRPDDWEATREKWLEKRPDLVEDYRMKRKRAVRKGQTQSQRGKFGKTQRGGRR